jgi:dUTP pyrophosphatase
MKTRGFEVISQFINQDIHLPKRATTASAGYDLEAAVSLIIAPGETVLIQTGIKAYMLSDEVLQLYIRSSIAKNKRLVLVNHVGIIDADYYNNPSNEGHILLAMQNLSTKTQVIQKYERLAQGIFMKYLTGDDEPSEIGKRRGGFGSSQD